MATNGIPWNSANRCSSSSSRAPCSTKS
jgi:hypothetical protein